MVISGAANHVASGPVLVTIQIMGPGAPEASFPTGSTSTHQVSMEGDEGGNCSAGTSLGHARTTWSRGLLSVVTVCHCFSSSSTAAWGSGDGAEQEARRRLAARRPGKKNVLGGLFANLCPFVMSLQGLHKHGAQRPQDLRSTPVGKPPGQPRASIAPKPNTRLAGIGRGSPEPFDKLRASSAEGLHRVVRRQRH